MVVKLNGTRFAQILRAGTLAVVREQESLNRINVFPVPDADTGANLAATLKAASARLGDDSPDGVGDAARAAADAALDGARGNSGAILAQFLHGLARAVRGEAEVDTRDFALAADQGTAAAYQALQNPREGTILSVLRAWAHELREHSATVEDFGELMSRAIAGAQEALRNTPKQLEVLAKNHVVDAGGQGFVFFLEGALDSFRTGKVLPWEPIEAPARGVAPFAAAHADMEGEFRYCTEALVAAPRDARADGGEDGLDREAVLAAVRPFGDSLVVAGGSERLRVHIHTNEPKAFLETLGAIGVIERSKIDDMVLQQLSAREATIAIVADSTCDLPEATANRLGLVTVPLTISFGDDDFLDGVDITTDGFYRRLANAPELPRSSQPAAADFRDTYEHLLQYREGIVSVHIAAAMSGTCQSAATAARDVDPARVKVIDSCTVSVGAGLLIEAIGDAVAQGANLDEIEELAKRVRADITVFGTVSTLDFAVRGGRVSARSAWIINLLNLYPIIVFDEQGRAGKGGAHFGFKGALQGLVKRVERFADGNPAKVMVVHTGERKAAEYTAGLLERRLGVRDVPVVRAGPVLITHVGPQSVSIAVRRNAL